MLAISNITTSLICFFILTIPQDLLASNMSLTHSPSTPKDTVATPVNKKSVPNGIGKKISPSMNRGNNKPTTASLYKPPKGMGRPWPTQGGGTRSQSNCNPQLAVLAPADHTGLTQSHQPNLYWYVSDICPGTFVFTLLEEEGIAPLIERSLEAPQQPGIQKLSLHDLNQHLKIGKRYQWSIALIVDPNHRSKDIVAMGGIARISDSIGKKDSEVLKKKTDAETYLESGFWYDGIEALSEKIEENQNAEVTAQRKKLIHLVGLKDIVTP